MPAIQDIEWLEPLIEPEQSRELEQYARSKFGIVPHAIGFFAACPWIMRAMIDMLAATRVHVGHNLVDMVALIVSQDNSCRYCYGASRLFLRIMGMPAARIRALEENLETAQINARTKLALDFARRISRSNPLPSAEDKKALSRAGYGEAEIKELAFVAGEEIFHNRVSTLAALPPARSERLAESWLIGLIRPFMARVLRTKRKSGPPEPLPDELKCGPYTYMVLALDGLPEARMLRRILDDAWASLHISLRAKALIFAVIARGLGCSRAESEATRLLALEGLTAGATEEVLAHLTSRELDPVEQVIAPYARETIWYEPASVQRRGGDLKRRLTKPQLLEVIGIASLANMVCRLDILVDEP